jgi:mono/diheme cytochrome c family protein
VNSYNEQHPNDQLQPERDLVEINHAPAPIDAHKEEGFLKPIPLWLIAFSMFLFFWAGLYLAYNSGGFKSTVFNASVVSWSGGGAGSAPAPIDPKVLGKKVFTQNCAVCHQSTGLGVPAQFPPLAGSEWVLSQDWHGDNHLVKNVLYGLQGPVIVKKMPFNNAMAPWNQLSDQKISAVLTYIRSAWGNNAPPISPEFVAKVREDNKSRTEAWTMPELKAIPKEMCSGSADAPAPKK